MEKTLTKIHKYCQSCGMNIKKDENKGTGKSQVKNYKYCKHCFVSGEFTEAHLTVNQVRERAINYLCEVKHLPKFLAVFLTKNMYKLARWQGDTKGYGL